MITVIMQDNVMDGMVAPAFFLPFPKLFTICSMGLATWKWQAGTHVGKLYTKASFTFSEFNNANQKRRLQE